MFMVFCLGLLLSMTSAYTVRVFTRTTEDANTYFGNQSKVRQIIGSINLISLLGIILWGFINLSWYIPIVLFLIVSFVVGYIFGRDRLFLFYSIQPLIDILSFGILIFLWFN